MMFLTRLSESPDRFLPLLLVLGLAFLVPILMARLKGFPVVVGEIVAGIVIGASGFQLVQHGVILDFLSDIGLAFLMFIAGMEIDFEAILPRKGQRQKGPNVVAYAFGIYLATFGLAYAGSLLMARLGYSGDPLMLAFVFSATSLGVLLPVLKSRQMLRRFDGQLIFVTAMLADFLTVIAFTVYTLIYDRGFSAEILSLGLLFVAFLIFARLGPRVFGMPQVRELIEKLSQSTVQIKVRGAMAILMVFVVMAEFLKAELILGAFLAGMIISLLRTPADHDLVHQLEAFGFGFFIPVFFIMVGAGLDLRAILAEPQTLGLLPIYLLVSMVIKVAPMLLARRHLGWRQLTGAGLLLNTHLSLEVAVAVIGERLGLLDVASSTSIIVFATLTVLIMPLLFGALVPEESAQPAQRKYILGAGPLAVKTGQELAAHGDKVAFLALPGMTFPADFAFPVVSLPEVEAFAAQVNADEVEALLLLSEDEEDNRQMARVAYQMGLENVIGVVEDPSLLPLYRELNVQVYSPAMQRATMLSMMARSPDALGLLTSTEDAFDVFEVELRNRQLHARTVRELQLPGGVLLLALRRDGVHQVPRGSTDLQVGDHLTLFAPRELAESLRNWLEGRGPQPDWGEILV